MQPPRQKDSEEIHLSVVATSRNDNHGGSLTCRMQHFVNGFVAQCKRHNLRAELIMVEWNPPSDRVPLAQELRWPDDTGPCDIRIITVPPEVHQTFDHSDKLPLFQMIAKNVGIRRARGRFVLATNIDILFSDESIIYMRDRLRDGVLYRNDRIDVPTEVPHDHDFAKVLDWCWKNYFRINANGITVVKSSDGWSNFELLKAYMVGPKLRWFIMNLKKAVLNLPAKFIQAARNRLLFQPANRLPLQKIQLAHSVVRMPIDLGHKISIFLISIPFSIARSFVGAFFHTLHFLSKPCPFTNACGDFTLLSQSDWRRLHGYPEWAMYSFHLDSVLLYQAKAAGIQERYMGRRAAVFHIEHQPGSGFTPEDPSKLFERLTRNGIPYLDWNKDVVPLIDRISQADGQERIKSYQLAGPDWGLATLTLEETKIGCDP